MKKVKLGGVEFWLEEKRKAQEQIENSKNLIAIADREIAKLT